jgi:hypothetical protein
VKGITGESFILESLILPQGIPALCDDPGLRTKILATLPTLNESGVAVHQTGGRDPHRGIQNSDAPAGGPQSTGVAPSAPVVSPSTPAVAPSTSVAAPRPLDNGKGLQVVPPPHVAPEGRRKRGDADGSFISDPPRSVRGLLVG